MLPKHIGFIIDGNRRWAKAKGLPSSAGHLAGIKRVKEIGDQCLAKGIAVVTFWGFSTDNWQRSKEEVNYIFKLFEQFGRRYLDQYIAKGVAFRHLGTLNRLPKSLQRVIRQAIEHSPRDPKMTVNLAINYGGRDEILRAIEQMSKLGVPMSKLTQEQFSQYLDTNDLPDPDLVIRTSGEQRLSGFMPWQTVYSELYFAPVPFPDFTPAELDRALDWYASRERRFGQ